MSNSTGSTQPPDPSDVGEGEPKISAAEAEVLREEVLHELEETEGPRGQPWYNLVSAAVVLILSLFALVTGVSYGLGAPSEPGPGMWPFALGLLTGGMAIIVGLRFRRVDDIEKFNSGSVHVLLGVVSMVVFWVLLPLVGFEVPSLLLCFVWLRLLGRENWRVTISASLGIVLAFYLVFVIALGVPVPRLI